MSLLSFISTLSTTIETHIRRSWKLLLPGAVVLVLICAGIFALIISGRVRKQVGPTSVSAEVEASATSTEAVSLVERRLDGERVSREESERAPWAVMVDNHLDARPQSGLSQAQVVIEAPVEGGITRFLAFFAPTTTVPEVGPVRSARPYFVDWAEGWKAMYVHVGGSPDALDVIREKGKEFFDVNEMSVDGWAFWRSSRRSSPHSVVTDGERLSAIAERKGFASSTMPLAWHFLPEATSTDPGGVSRVSIPYGGSYSVIWKFDATSGRYQRSVGGRISSDRDGSRIEAANVVVMKTDQTILDEVGRLRVRTVGSGEAIVYRDGEKFAIRWSRVRGEPIRFETIDGNVFLLRPGKTWIEVTTDDTIFGGFEG